MLYCSIVSKNQTEEAIKLASNQTKNRRQYDLRYVSTCADKRP